MPQFDFSVYLAQIFWMCISFGMLFWAIHTRVMPKITQLREKRDQRKDEIEQKIRAIDQKASILIQETEKSLQKARSDAATVVAQALQISEKQMQQALYAHQQSYQAQMETLKNTIESECVQAWKTLYNDLPPLCGDLVHQWSKPKNFYDQEKT